MRTIEECGELGDMSSARRRDMFGRGDSATAKDLTATGDGASGDSSGFGVLGPCSVSGDGVRGASAGVGVGGAENDWDGISTGVSDGSSVGTGMRARVAVGSETKSEASCSIATSVTCRVVSAAQRDDVLVKLTMGL